MYNKQIYPSESKTFLLAISSIQCATLRIRNAKNVNYLCVFVCVQSFATLSWRCWPPTLLGLGHFGHRNATNTQSDTQKYVPKGKN